MTRAVALAALAFACFSPFTFSQSSRRAVLGVVDVSGHIQPLAHLGPSGWISSWPGPEEEETPFPSLGQVPPEWLAGPVPREWAFYTTRGERHAALRPVDTARCCGCVAPIVLSTGCGSLCEAAGDEGWAGLALDGGLIVLRLDSSVPRDPGFVPALRPAFDAGVPAAIEDFGERFMVEGVVPPATAYLARPVVIDRVFRLDGRDEATMYVEAVRELETDHGPDRLVLSAWVRRAGGKYRVITSVVLPTHSSEEKIERIRMLGAVDDPGGPTWVAAISTYESGEYALVRLDGMTVRRILSIDRGGC